MEYWNGTKVRLSGDPLPDSEYPFPEIQALMMFDNEEMSCWCRTIHQKQIGSSHGHWDGVRRASVTWKFASRRYVLSFISSVNLLQELQFVPGLGWAIDNLDYPFFSRKWEFDEALIKHSMTSFIEDKFRLWLTIFPEGTDFTEAKQKKSWEVCGVGVGKRIRRMDLFVGSHHTIKSRCFVGKLCFLCA